jgi:hypothetical protein
MGNYEEHEANDRNEEQRDNEDSERNRQVLYDIFCSIYEELTDLECRVDNDVHELNRIKAASVIDEMRDRLLLELSGYFSISIAP